MVTRLTSEDVLTEETETNLRLSKVLNKLYPDPTERRYILNQLADISREIVITIENEVGSFGELAVDLCIDQYNAIKLLEINSKPDNLFSQIRAYQLRNLAGSRLLNYDKKYANKSHSIAVNQYSIWLSRKQLHQNTNEIMNNDKTLIPKKNYSRLVFV